MTLAPTDYRDRRREAAAHDRAWQGAYRAGAADGRRGRRRHRERTAALVLLVALLAVLWPLGTVVLAVVTVRRQHRRWGDRWRTVALAATWLACAGLVLLAIDYRTPWPLLAVPAALLGWAGERASRRHGLRRSLRYREPSPGPPAPAIEPYRVTFTSKAQHVETRRYPDGSQVTIDTRTGETAPDPWDGF